MLCGIWCWPIVQWSTTARFRFLMNYARHQECGHHLFGFSVGSGLIDELISFYASQFIGGTWYWMNRFIRGKFIDCEIVFICMKSTPSPTRECPNSRSALTKSDLSRTSLGEFFRCSTYCFAHFKLLFGKMSKVVQFSTIFTFKFQCSTPTEKWLLCHWYCSGKKHDGKYLECKLTRKINMGQLAYWFTLI